MDTQRLSFKRILLTIIIILYLLTILWFSYQNWSDASIGSYKWWMVLGDILILSIPIIALYGSIYILVITWREYTAGVVQPQLAKTLYWAPRIATIIIIMFLSLFSFDVFETEAPLLEILVGFIIHNIPSIVLTVLLLVAWKRPVIGFVGFLAATVAAVVFFVHQRGMLASLIMLVSPILVIAFLFYADWKVNNQQRS